MLDNKGFTLLEMLMVLLVVTVIIYSFSNVYYGYIVSNKLSQSVMQFSTVLDEAKYCAILNNQDTYITIHENYYTYRCKEEKKYDFEKGVKVTSNYSSGIKFTSRGTVNRAGTITFECDGKQKQIVISIGNGGYYVK